MTSIISAGQSISSIGKSMTAIARVEDHLATFMKKVIYYEKFFQRMGPNLPGGLMDTAKLIFLRCYEYRDEIRDELESSVAYVADAGRWVVGMGDWNSKMEKRLAQISELVLLANTLLAEYAVTGAVGADDARDELDAYLQLLSATVTLKYAPANAANGKSSAAPIGQRPANGRPQPTQAKSNTFEEFSSEMTGLGNELSGAFSEMFGSKDLGRSKSFGGTRQDGTNTVKDNDAMNPFAESYRRPVDPYASAASSTGASVSSSTQSLPGITAGGTLPQVSTDTENSVSGGESPESPMSPVSLGEYECLEMDSIPKYAAFKTSARRQHGYTNGNGSLANSMISDGGRSAYSESTAEYHELFPLPPSQAVSRSLSSLDKTKKSAQPIMDMNYSYDFQCEAAHNPFLSPNTPGLIAEPAGAASLAEVKLGSSSSEQQQPSSVEDHTKAPDGEAATEAPVATISESTMPASTGSVDHDEAGGSTLPAEAKSVANESVLATVAPPPTLHPAVEYTHAHAAPAAGNLSSSQSLHSGSVKLHDSAHYDETEALAAALSASVADQHHSDSDHEYDLFGCGKP